MPRPPKDESGPVQRLAIFLPPRQITWIDTHLKDGETRSQLISRLLERAQKGTP